MDEECEPVTGLRNVEQVEVLVVEECGARGSISSGRG